jgi:glycosyltransferase involved in cell wall biosynthesis
MLIRNGYPADRLRISPHGIDLSWLAQLRPRRAESHVQFGYIGDTEIRQAFLRRAFHDLDLAVAPTHFLAEMLIRNGYPAERLRISPHGIDLSWLAQLRPRRTEAHVRFGYIGTISPIKGVDLLIQAFRSISAEVPASLRVYGDLEKTPSYGRALLDAADGCPSVEFAGSFDHSQITDVLSDLDAVVVPSLIYENSPLVIAEAFAAKRPVIATRLGGMAELVTHDVNGLLFQRGDVTSLADCLRRFASDATFRERLRDGIGSVRSIENEAQALIEIYSSLLSQAVVRS